MHESSNWQTKPVNECKLLSNIIACTMFYACKTAEWCTSLMQQSTFEQSQVMHSYKCIIDNALQAAVFVSHIDMQMTASV